MSSNKTAYLSAKLAVRAHPKKGGLGVFACQPVKAGELLAVWSGELCDWDELHRLPLERRQHSLQVEENLYLVTTILNEAADYVNHSCNPNAGLDGQIVIRAMRNIAVGEEVCYDYAMSDGSPYDEFACACGTPNCRRQITGNDWRCADLQRKYASWFSSYLQRRIDQLNQAKLHVNGFYPPNPSILAQMDS